MAKKEMEVVKGLFFFVSLLSSLFMCVLCSRSLNPGPNLSYQSDSVPTVVKGLDLKRYMGRWYEIASLPASFKPKNATDTRATYTLKENGTVDVLNESWVNGKRVYIKGILSKVDPSSDEAKFIVQFFVPPFPFPTGGGDYWVLYVDAHYQYAIVGQPNRKNLGILSRKSHIDDETYKQLVQKCVEEGFDVSNLQKTPQSPIPPK